VRRSRDLARRLQLYLLPWFGFVRVLSPRAPPPHHVPYGITGLRCSWPPAHELGSRFWALAPAVGFLVLLLLP
jgi:hypothetical protein